MSASTPAPAPRPEILAPAGDTPSFLAALAAGADALYVGLKHFSARMEAENFGIGELARLTDVAHEAGSRVYVAMNTLVKPGECGAAWRLIARLATRVRPDGLIIQDPGLLDIARQAGFTGGLFLSTLANVTHPLALREARKLGASRVILPRELSIDEIRAMGAACPDGLDLECFVQGALCYCVSGRCYWSSYMGGKSGLRGRCVQPCRRVYRQGGHPARGGGDARQQGRRGATPQSARHAEGRGGHGRSGRFFSCRDLELGPLVKTLLDVPHLASWKIEGRKKGPHYVYHTVTAYRLLRDNPGDAAARRAAADILAMALGRPGGKARFLPQSPEESAAPEHQTSSGLLAGKIRIAPDGGCELKPHFELLPGDYLRVGVEDERWHATVPVTRRVPKAGTLRLRLARHATPKAGTPVFLIDRREPELMRLLADWRGRLDARKSPAAPDAAPAGAPRFPRAVRPHPRPDMLLTASLPRGRAREDGAASAPGRGDRATGRRSLPALWLSPRTAELSRTLVGRVAWWLPPVVWPEEEDALARMLGRLWRQGARHFVCNAPWQRALFPDRLPEDADLLAGPFCNTANAAALGMLAGQGFSGAFVSPELARDDALALPAQSPLPLGAVLSGFWPVGLSRFGLAGIRPNEPFTGPKGEVFWARRYGGTLWIYPAWPLDLSAQRRELADAGYSFFVRMEETPPAALPELRRQGLFNWNGALL